MKEWHYKNFPVVTQILYLPSHQKGRTQFSHEESSEFAEGKYFLFRHYGPDLLVLVLI